jgi:hypothetical protein
LHGAPFSTRLERAPGTSGEEDRKPKLRSSSFTGRCLEKTRLLGRYIALRIEANGRVFAFRHGCPAPDAFVVELEIHDLAEAQRFKPFARSLFAERGSCLQSDRLCPHNRDDENPSFLALAHAHEWCQWRSEHQRAGPRFQRKDRTRPARD